MKGLYIHTIVYSVMLIFCCMLNTVAQVPDATVFWIKVYGAPPAFAHMTFGNRVGNTTSGIDNGLEFPIEFREQEPPPPAPSLDAVWAPVRASQFGSGVRGLLERQFNAWPGLFYDTQKDTFRINFVQADNVDQDISFKWIDSLNIVYQCDSLVMVYLDPSVGSNVRLNMMSTDTLVIPAAGTNGVGFVRIFKYGGSTIVTDANVEQSIFDFRLHQNFPNPFNPSTEIQYVVSRREYVSLKIYDVLGQEVTVLVNEMQEPGMKTVMWDALNVPSGIYFYRIQASAFMDVKKMILVK